MATESRHFKEEIQELLDNCLSSSARAEVDAHLQTCEECRRELEALRFTRRISRESLAPHEIPVGLERSINKALDSEDQSSKAEESLNRKRVLGQRPIMAYVFLLLIAVFLVLNYFIKRPGLPSEVAGDFVNFKAGRLAVQLETGDVKVMEKFFTDGGIPFSTRVFDLGMMNYRLVGGRVHQLINRKSALFVYRGEGNKILVCQMYPGHVSELPPGSEVRENKGIQFHIYRKAGVTMAFWQEGSVTCVLTSDIDPQELIQLAFAKAMQITSGN